MVILFHCEIKGKPTWTSIDNSTSDKCITITTIESNKNRYKAKVEIHGYYDNVIGIGGSIYHQLSFDEPGSLCFVGEPALPIISRQIALPKGEDLDIKIRNEKWSEEFYIGQVMPKQRSVHETDNKQQFEIDTTIYGEEEYQTQRFYKGELQRWRGVNNRSLNICPFRYRPREGRLSVITEFIIDIAFEGEETGNLPKADDTHIFLNKINCTERSIAVQLRDSTEAYDYLIIAGNIPGILESQALANFRRWKAYKGYRTKMISKNTIGNGPSQIKQFIESEYAKGVKYVLLLGNHHWIPTYFYTDSNYDAANSDYWYGCMGDATDVEADISIGRFPANDLPELESMINKTISYESSTRSYGNEALLVAHGGDGEFDFHNCSEAIRTWDYNNPLSFTTAYGKLFNMGCGVSNDSVRNEINEGKNIINYRGLGGHDCWYRWNGYSEDFYDTEVNLLSNSTNDVYFCIASYLGYLGMYRSFMESFMSADNGAVSMIAASGDVYYIPNTSFNKHLFIKLLNDSIYNIGDLNVTAHMATIASATGDDYQKTVYNAFAYLCGGDPSLEIITDNTSVFDDYTLSLNGQNLIVYCKDISEYKVCIVNENDSLLSVVNSTNATCSLSMPTDNFYLVLNRHNYVPRIIYVNVADTYIQNKVFNNSDVDYYYLKDASISAGHDVTASIPFGNVIIERGSKLSINKKNGVRIKNGFKCKIGGELQIK